MKFNIGDMVRCKKKYSGLYSEVNMDALCKVLSYDKRALNGYRYYSYVGGKRKKMCNNLRVKIVAHKKEQYVGMVFVVYDYHFKRMTKRDENTFLLYRI